MKILRKTVLGVLAFMAFIAVSMSGRVLRERPPELTTSALVYVVLLVASVIYFHWLFRAFLMPFSGLSKEEQAAFLNRALGQYRIGFFAGTIGFGYFYLALYVFGFFHDLPDKSDVPNFTMGAIFFIGLGVLAQARSLILSLIKPESNEECKTASEPTHSTNDNSTARLGSPEISQPPASPN
jgi:hypothetical protein